QATARYKVETLRLIANMSLGVGALAIIGGTVVIVTTLTMSTGGLVGIQLYRSLSDVGVQALSGFASAYINTRISSPLIADIGLAATIGAGADCGRQSDIGDQRRADARVDVGGRE
ncbi:ABC transporter permease, partial [Mycobacterium avium]